MQRYKQEKLILQRSEQRGHTHRVPEVAFEGEALTSELKERVLTSDVKDGMERKESNIPLGGVGPS